VLSSSRWAAAPAVAGAACISSSAVVMQLAGSSPSATALGRCGFALPVLGLLAWLERRRGAGTMTARSRWLARVAGAFLAADLIVWSHSIADIGAGLGTVITNLQVVIVALFGWLVLGERPRPALLVSRPRWGPRSHRRCSACCCGRAPRAPRALRPGGVRRRWSNRPSI
jgi:drug/metabolite transporter (DMT)-like permease